MKYAGSFGGSPRIDARGGALQRSGKGFASNVGFSPGDWDFPAAKAE